MSERVEYMNFVFKPVSTLSKRMSEIETDCKDNDAVVLTNYGKATFAILEIDKFKALVKQAQQAKMFKALWESEVNIRQGKMLSAKEALLDYDNLDEMEEGREAGRSSVASVL